IQPELPCDELRVDRMRRSGERARAERRYRGALARLGDPLTIAPQGFDVREKVVRQRDGLRPLQVRVSGHHRLDFGGGPINERDRQVAQRSIQIVAEVERQKAQVERERCCKPADAWVEWSPESTRPEVLHLVRLARLLAPAFVDRDDGAAAESAFRGVSSAASLPSPQSAWVRACVRRGSPKTV